MALDKIPQVKKIDAVAQPHTTPEEHICTWFPLPSLMNKHKGKVKSTMDITMIAIAMDTIISILIYI